MHLTGFRALISRSILSILLVRAGLVAAAPTFTVNNAFDVPADPADTDYSVCRTSASNSNCTLRAAIMKANHYAGGGVTINIPAGTFTITIPKVSPDDETTGDLNILQNMTINGATTASTFVDGGALDRVFRIESGTVIISNMTVQNGFASGGQIGGAIFSQGNITLNNLHLTKNNPTNGGGLGAVLGSAVLNNCLIDYNNAPGVGGGIAGFSNPITLNNCTVANNTSGNSGGGLYSQRYDVGSPAGDFILNNSSVIGNHAGTDGGAIKIEAGNGSCTVTINNSTINANSASLEGGGIYVSPDSVLVMNNSTISANTATDSGGGIMNLGNTSLFFVTLAGNVSDNDAASTGSGGGIRNSSPGTVDLWNSLLAENFANTNSNDWQGVTITSHDYNYIQVHGATNGTVTHDLMGGDILLDGLRPNGAPTQTRALFVGSPAIDRIPANLCRDSFGTAPIPDQRSVPRPVGATGDMGAFEGSIQPIYNRNLIRNGEAENGGGSPAGKFVGTPNWTVTSGQFTAVPYNSPGGFPNTTTDPVPAQRGFNFFSGGNSAMSGATQTINVSVIGTKIDGGNQAFTFSGDFGGYAAEADATASRITFLNSSSAAIGNTVDFGPFAPSDRGNVTGFKNHSATGVLPVGTRSVKVEVVMLRSQGTANDGYLDNLSFVLPPPPRLANISTRAFVQTGDNVLIGGFIINGSGAKKVMVRVIGPSLSSAGIASPLQNPTLELRDGAGTLITFNDNWGDAANHVEINNSGLAPGNGLEPAILTSLNPGAYTGIVRGVSNGTGVALIEGYDLDRSAASKLANISTRSFVQTGDNVMIGGLIVNGTSSQNVIVRALGPSLSSAGVSNPLADPTLELRDGNGGFLASNDNWRDTQETQIQTSGLAPSRDAESAILRTLPPGAYTAIVRGQNNSIGNALVEVFAVN